MTVNNMWFQENPVSSTPINQKINIKNHFLPKFNTTMISNNTAFNYTIRLFFGFTGFTGIEKYTHLTGNHIANGDISII